MKKLFLPLILMLTVSSCFAEGTLFIRRVLVVPNDCPPGENLGSVTITPIGGAPPYQFKKGTGDFQDIATFLTGADESGPITFIVRDSKGAMEEATVDVGPSPFSSVTYNLFLPCADQDNGRVEIIALGGTGLITFQLDEAVQETPNFVEIPAGVHTILVTSDDPVECNDNSLTFNFPETTPVTITNIETFPADTPICKGTVVVTATGGSGSFCFLVNIPEDLPGESVSAENLNIISGLEASTDYEVFVRDLASGDCGTSPCSARMDFEILATDNEIHNFLQNKHC